MARKEIYFKIEAKGRDTGKVFHLKEMSATAAEWWAIRAGMAMAKNGVNLPDNFTEMGMAGMAKAGLEMVAKIPPEDAKPLLDELMKCVQAVPNPDNQAITRSLIDDDTEEVATRLKLRAEVFKLHVDFFTAASL
ncbi:hypothetical protein N5923_23295 [Erwiniaceae bacterium BAC15a-03b]|uniref:Uncharacterized protein n=1 Tax=Winslowiella arboricola TaxID=2978220 RepID=A0A9J6PXF6_9GAMM|nr:hypothetical protein [Winslowiella arboricola]MCU5775125.1 hypothetical protein [Winslowiella arboricola]MCU5780421.1 hypothetical protein [Winslowiella arboricola]